MSQRKLKKAQTAREKLAQRVSELSEKIASGNEQVQAEISAMVETDDLDAATRHVSDLEREQRVREATLQETERRLVEADKAIKQITHNVSLDQMRKKEAEAVAILEKAGDGAALVEYGETIQEMAHEFLLLGNGVSANGQNPSSDINYVKFGYHRLRRMGSSLIQAGRILNSANGQR